MTDYDSPWKEVLEVYFELFLAFLFPDVHTAIDWSRGFEFLDKELQQVVREGEGGRRYVDKLVKVWLKDGSEGWILIHVEVQAHEEEAFATRMYIYNYRLFDRYNRKVVSLAILADDQADWRPDRYSSSLLGCSIDFRFPVVKLLRFAQDWQALERDPNPFATVVLAHLKCQETRWTPDERLSWKTRLVKGLFERGFSEADVYKLFRFIDWIMDLPEGMDGIFWQEIREYQEEKRMPFMTTPERLARKQALLEGRYETIECALKLRFGDASLELMPEVCRITDLDALRVLRDKLLAGVSLDDFRQHLAALMPSIENSSARN